jgi:hypothetical protein
MQTRVNITPDFARSPARQPGLSLGHPHWDAPVFDDSLIRSSIHSRISASTHRTAFGPIFTGFGKRPKDIAL